MRSVTAVSVRTGAPVLPPLTVGCSFGHGTEIPGTLSLTPELLVSTIRAIAEWAAHSGLRRLIFVNGHFGNAGALLVATDHIRLERKDLRAGFRWLVGRRRRHRRRGLRRR